MPFQQNMLESIWAKKSIVWEGCTLKYHAVWILSTNGLKRKSWDPALYRKFVTWRSDLIIRKDHVFTKTGIYYCIRCCCRWPVSPEVYIYIWPPPWKVCRHVLHVQYRGEGERGFLQISCMLHWAGEITATNWLLASYTADSWHQPQ